MFDQQETIYAKLTTHASNFKPLKNTSYEKREEGSIYRASAMDKINHEECFN